MVAHADDGGTILAPVTAITAAATVVAHFAPVLAAASRRRPARPVRPMRWT
jgi:hypothetical protein